MKKQLLPLLLILPCTLLSGCDYLASFTTNVQQGNIIEAKEVAQLKKGMTKREVANLMGNPVYDNTFDDERWVYVYTSQVGRRPLVHKRLIIRFQNNRIAQIEREPLMNKQSEATQSS